MKKLAMLCLMFCFLLPACGQGKKEEDGQVKKIYYINNKETNVEMHEAQIYSQDTIGQVEELITLLGTGSEKMAYKAPLQMGFEVYSYHLEGDKVYLDVSEVYRDLSPTTEILVRAAIVRTLSQANGVKYVSITVEGGQLHDSLGNIVGIMSADQFVDNDGDAINAYEKVRLKLYFTNAEGTGLVATNRTLAYNTNISMEKLVVEQLLMGPSADVSDMVYPTINPDTKIMSISVKDGICYVNFDSAFLTQNSNVSSEVIIYSIVNSLIELNNVNKVQISVNGETDIMFRETISLGTVFERRLDLITTAE